MVIFIHNFVLQYLTNMKLMLLVALLLNFNYEID